MSEENAAKKQLVADMFGKAVGFYDEAPFFHVFGPKLVETAGVLEGSKVLDIATGRGAVLFPAADRVGPSGKVTGIDIAEPMVAATAADARERRLANVAVIHMDAENLDFPDASFDFVLCGFGIMFIPNLAQALSEMRRVLRPGGFLAVTTWGSTGEINRRYSELARAHSIESTQLATQPLNDLESLDKVLQQAGFQDVHTSAEVATIVYPTEEDWWQRRAALPRIASNELEPAAGEKLRQEAFAMLQEYKQSDGIHETRTANIAVASVPHS